MSLSTPASENLFAPVAELLAMGGPVMGVLLTISVLGLGTVLYTLIISLVQAPRLNRSIRAGVDQWCDGDDEAALRSLGGQRNPLAELLAFIMHRRSQGETEDSLRDEVGRRAQRLLQPFESPLKILEVIAALAPLIGLLGTVMGMMSAFDAMANAQGQADPAELSGGIYEALSTTATGLAIAIPFAAIAAWMEFRMRRMQQQINDLLVRIFRREVPGDRPREAPATSETQQRSDDHGPEPAQRHAMA
ncbi:MotA/TolQ/ExbB proton channel family protein [Halomonadaceae bacterium KBTZ08]